MEFPWSKTEKKIARKAFDLAYDRKCQEIIEQIKRRKLSTGEDIWKLGSYIHKQQKEIDRLFDYRYSQLVLVFAILIKKKLLSLEDLAGLNDEKIDIINKTLEIASH
ncbi:MAG: hypothetical protein KQH63_09000 [Desulfobulbaceae bacterium]|nr:hypothetical protein [Desulfobulbaceae bacterium]